MTRHEAAPRHGDIRQWGQLIGEALGEGIVEGVRNKLGTGAYDLEPFVEQILSLLREEVLAGGVVPAEPLHLHRATEADEQLAAIARADDANPCEEEACLEPAVARNLCRRHYARKLYQERKERLGAHGLRVVPTSYGGGNVVAEKKPLAPVGPIIRRKKADGPEQPIVSAVPPPPSAAHVPGPVLVKPLPQAPPAEVTTPSPIAAAAAAAGVTVESVARFLLGGGKG